MKGKGKGKGKGKRKWTAARLSQLLSTAWRLAVKPGQARSGAVRFTCRLATWSAGDDWRRAKEKRWLYSLGHWDGRCLLQNLAGKSQQAGGPGYEERQNRDGAGAEGG